MSFILDSLRRIEQERRIDASPDLNLIAGQAPDKKWYQRAWVWIGIGLLANALVLAVILMPQKRGRPDLQPPVPSSPANPDQVRRNMPKAPSLEPEGLATNPADRPAMRPLAAEAHIPAQSRTPRTASSAATDATLPSASEAPQEAVASPSEPKASIPEETEQQVTQPPAPAPPETPSQQADTSVAHSVPVDRHSPPTSLQSNIPLLNELTPEVQQRIGSLEINVHVYYDEPARSMVYINLRPYRVGDRIGPDGPLLTQITRDGIVIDYGEGLARVLTSR